MSKSGPTTFLGTAFGYAWAASGIRGFCGEEYWYQKLFARYIPWYSFKGVTFVAKTVTAHPREGNMPLDKDGFSPREKRPACIVLGFWQFLWGVMLNAVGLSNIGIEAIIKKGLWQRIPEPFMISVMPVCQTRSERKKEMQKIVAHLTELVPELCGPVAIQVNRSCPNVKHGRAQDKSVTETLDHLRLFEGLRHEYGARVFVKIDVFTSIEDARRIANHPVCSGLIVSNTMSWATVPKWMRRLFFGSTTSPLARFGGGGLSGWPLRRRVSTWIRTARKAGITKHINAGGGIFGPLGVWSAWRAGADSVSLGTIATVRPWMLRPTVIFATWLFDHFPRRIA